MWFHSFHDRETFSLNLSLVASVLFPVYAADSPPEQVTFVTATGAKIQKALPPAKIDELKALIGAPTWKDLT